MLLVALAFMTVGYTLLYAGIKGGPSDQWARQPWTLWSDAFNQLGTEASQRQAGITSAVQRAQQAAGLRTAQTQQQSVAGAGSFAVPPAVQQAARNVLNQLQGP
jgi:hypothetical protein